MSGKNPVSEILGGAPAPDPLSQVRGLTASTPPVAVETHEAVRVPIESLVAWDVCQKVRGPAVDGDALQALKANIKEHGIRNPLWVAPSKSGKLLVIAGYRRLRCAKELGHKTVPVIEQPVENENDAKLLAVIENTAREDLSDMDGFRILDWIRRTNPKCVHDGSVRGPQMAKGRFNVSTLSNVMGRPESWCRLHARAAEVFTLPELERIEAKIVEGKDKEDDDSASILTWYSVMRAVSAGGNAELYRDQILAIVDNKAVPEPKEKEKPKKNVLEARVRVKFTLLDKAGVILKLGAAPGAGIDSVILDARTEVKFKLGKIGFLQGERGLQKTREAFKELAAVFTKLSEHAADPTKASDNEIEELAGLREAMDSALGKLAEKIA